MMAMANFISRSRSPRQNSRCGNTGSRKMELLWKRNEHGSWGAKVSISAIQTDI